MRTRASADANETLPLFGETAHTAADAESQDARQRRRNRTRQMQWRRRHQFAPPLIEAPNGPSAAPAIYTTCGG